MTSLELRPYQEATVAAVEAAHAGQRRPTGTGVMNRPAAVLATGMGKTVIFSELARRAHENRRRTLVLVHREELALQAAAKLHSAAPRARIGIVKAERDEWEADIVVGSVPTLARANRRGRIPANRFGLIIADECHHAAADSWGSVLDHFGAFSSYSSATSTVGFTATMARGDDRALGRIWPEVAATYGIDYGVANGYLVKPRGVRVSVPALHLDEVKRSRGDFQDSDLGDAMMDANAGDAIAAALLEHAMEPDGHSVRRTALFCPSVASSIRFAEDLNRVGIATEVITGSTPSAERALIYAAFQRGDVQVISSCMVLTEGWDAPWAEVAVIARPTQSSALYVQMVGRVLRPWAPGGKTGALVMDVVGANTRHTLATLVDLFPTSGDGRATRDPNAEPVEKLEGLAEWDDGTRESAGTTVVGREFDLFGDRPSVWLQTLHGVWFVPVQRGYYFLWPRPAQDGRPAYALGRKAKGTPPGMAGVKPLEKDLTLEFGMAWAERYASEEDAEHGLSISGRSASWRRKPPSPKMLDFALALGVPMTLPDGQQMRQGELSDLITVHQATRALPRP